MSLEPVREIDRLHIGCGGVRLDGWVNVDLLDLPEVDVVLDVTEGLPFTGVRTVYAEHFLEHLHVEDAISFLIDVHRVLAPDGLLRLSTPNLDWVLSTHYDPTSEPGVRLDGALRVNRAFHGWGHRFIWNRELLARTLESCGFSDLTWCAWGESEHEPFRGIERHEIWEDEDDLSHVLIVEARRATAYPETVDALRDLFRVDFIEHRNA